MDKTQKQQILIQTSENWRDQAISQTTFALYCDNSTIHFNFMRGLLASISQLNFYKNVDINIVDGGMTPEQIEILKKQFTIKNIKKLTAHGQDFILNLRHLPLVIARSELPKYFPGYRFYFAIDADTWIQDEHVIDDYLKLAMKQGIAVTAWESRFKDAFNYNPECIRESEFNENQFSKSPSYNIGVFCIDIESTYNFFEKWHELLLYQLKKCPNYYFTETSFNVMMAQNPTLSSLTKRANFPICIFIDTANPNNIHSTAKKIGSIIVDQEHNSIGILHLCANKALWNKAFLVYDLKSQQDELYSFQFS
jgi:hypothetical protein